MPREPPVTIKGTLETFNLRELLQMLAFNQKDGTLVLETERGPRTVHVEGGRLGLVQGDRHASSALARVLKRRGTVPADRMERAEQIQQRTSRFLGEVLLELGAVEPERFEEAYQEAVAESIFDLQLAKIQRFEFVEGRALAPDGSPGEPLEPRLVVDSLLLELTRKIDQWGVLCETVPSLEEVFEGTGAEVDLSGQEDLDAGQADRVVPRIDGYHTLDQVAEASDVDRYSVLQIGVALLQGGAIRPVPSEDLVARAEDLLSRGEATRALPLLRRALERGDAPPHARVRLADALEASGDPIAAAAELDAFAALAEESQAPEVFDALRRALQLRDDDPVTAARLCDHYLRHRPWLRAKRAEALEAVRTLMHGASAAGRPLDAAQRLACFLQNNDAPSEDLLLLADLYAAGGERTEAASALLRRAEDLLAVNRTAQARDLLRRALEHDPSRSDARRRLTELEGAAKRRRHKKRVTSLVVLLMLLSVGAGGAYWLLSREATRTLNGAREAAESALRDAEAQVTQRIGVWRASVTAGETAAEVPEGLPQAARSLLHDAKALAESVRAPLAAYTSEVRRESAGGEAGEVLVRTLEQRRVNLLGRAQQAVADVKRRAEQLLAEGETANRTGRFDAARERLVAARNLGFEDATVRERALVLLSHVDDYRARFQRAQEDIAALRQAGDVTGAAQRALSALRELEDSDLTLALRVPVELDSAPAGAEVLLGGKPTGLRTPCLLEYSPFQDTTVVLRLPGRTSALFKLPDYAAIEAQGEALAGWTPRVRHTLPEGVRWRIAAARPGSVAAIWPQADVLVALMSDGVTTRPVDVRAGTLGAGITAKLPNPMRLGGMLGGFEWRILGHRTLRVRTPQGESWEAQLTGRLERAPVMADGVIVAVDEAGTVYGFQSASGGELWRRALGAPPSQPPYAGPRGVVLATLSGSALALEPRTGVPRNLAPAGRGLTLALPLGGDILLVGVGENGLRRVAPDGAVTPLGEAAPLPDCEACVTPQGAAWVTRDGVVWLPAEAGAPVRVTALGERVARLAGDAAGLYAVGADGVLRAARQDRPAETLWATPVGGVPAAPPVVQGDAVFILIDGALVAVER